jgi:hypothetical protein
MTDSFNFEVEKMMAQMAEQEAVAKRQKEVEEEAMYRFALSKVLAHERARWSTSLEDKESAYEKEKSDLFNSWIKTGINHSLFAACHARECNDRFYLLWNKDELISAFWNYINANYGFSKCPSCGKTPNVNRFAEWTHQGYKNTSYIEGLIPVNPPYDGHNICGGSTIKSISCCEHLYDFVQKRRYKLFNGV